MATEKYGVLDIADDVENVEQYISGGLHPVHLGDKFDNDRYEVIHKLGRGGFSTVWLAQDLQDGHYVALKIVCSSWTESYGQLDGKIDKLLNPHPDSSHPSPARHFIVELRRFYVTSKNGIHLCQVLPVIGPSMHDLSQPPWRLRPAACRKLARDAAGLLASMHRKNICHGDFTPSNIGLDISPEFHKLSKHDFFKLVGPPEKEKVLPLSEKEKTGPGEHAPKYVVKSVELARLGDRYLSWNLRVMDFDQVFGAISPATPSSGIATPQQYVAPEALIDRKPGPGSDVWALGCTLFRMRSAISLFSDSERMQSWENHLSDIFDFTIGNPPAAWNDVIFPDDEHPVHGKVQKYGCDPIDRNYDLRAKVFGIWDLTPSRASTPAPSRSNSSSLAGGATRPGTPSAPLETPSNLILKSPRSVKNWFNVTAEEGFPHISAQEAELFYDLLKKIFEYDTRKRITAEGILAHPWLNMQ